MIDIYINIIYDTECKYILIVKLYLYNHQSISWTEWKSPC